MSNEFPMNKALVAIAKQYVGIVEVGGANRGQMVERFQKAVDGVAQGEPWCAAFVWFCIKEAQRLASFIYGDAVHTNTTLKLSEHVLTIWDKSPKEHRVFSPEPGDLILWQAYKDSKPTSSGHIEIISNVLDAHTVETIGGNTSGGPGVEREGDGVFSRTRIWQHRAGSLLHLGFLRVWP